MVKDYFQDITPPENAAPKGSTPRVSLPEPSEESRFDDTALNINIKTDAAPAPRGIRNISASPRRSSMRPAPGGGRVATPREAPPVFGGEPPARPPGRSRWWIWGLAALSVAVLGGLALFTLRSTMITVIPKSHDVVFDQLSTFTAYPEALAATGTLPYTTFTSDLEDSEVVKSEGTTHAETKASGSITVYNDYSAASVKLIKNTRFETPEGFIYRTPTEIVVPGKKGTTQGQVSVTVVADQAGEKYNVGPISRFTLPGLKTSGDMYTKVHAKSTAAFTGGFVGEQPAVVPGALESALSSVRARLEGKARDAIAAQKSDSTTIFPGLAQITYQDLPNTPEAGGGVRIHEKARIAVPVFSADVFAQGVAKIVSADAEGASVRLVPGANFAAAFLGTTSPALGADAITFTLSGRGQLVWNIDAVALSQALAGRDQGAFQTIINGFIGIQEAHARIEPFWKSTFPEDAADIKVDIKAPQAGE